MRFVLFWAVVLCISAGAVFGFLHWRHGQQPTIYRTVTVTRGDIRAAISATGTVEPEEVVDVGAQVLGRIESRGRDPHDSSKTIDYMSEVEEGTVLAQIDASVYRAQVEQTKAAVAQAEANVLQQQALLDKADRDWVRAQNLRKKGDISDADYDLALANYDAARALLAVNKATVESATANLRLAEVNLGYTTIVSPVKGVIVDRRVNVGQTVVASLTAPSLFLIAKDLTRLQVWASVNEADIGQVHLGQTVRFAVDAFPNDIFVGEVTQIRLNATMTQNVVTYTVVVTTDNSNGKLLPYLTANLNFEVGSRQNVLVVPNGALRWRPLQAATVVGESKAVGARDGKARGNEGRVWIQKDGTPEPIDVIVGLSDGTMTEIQSEQLADGVEIIMGEAVRKESASQSSPFAPKMFRSTTGGAGSTGGSGGGGGGH